MEGNKLAAANTSFTEDITEDIKQYGVVRVPLKAGFLETLLIRRAKCNDLHPNPEDEFSIPEVGPSFRIISEYENKMRDAIRRGYDPFSTWSDPVYVEKMYPDGYLLLNGHHRWAAAKRVGLKRIPIKIVNVTMENDIREMLERSTHDKRVTIDLDEIVFCANDDDAIEKPPGFPFNRIYKERIRRGIPSLCYYLSTRGYDIWAYTSGFYSVDHIRKLLKKHHIKADGIITGSSRSSRLSSRSKREMEKLIVNKYRETLNIYKDMVLLIHNHAYEFEQFDLDPSAPEWSQEVKIVLAGLESAPEKNE